ncbi:hypothetical protein M9458_025456, partial [Cirrhinus mrigala]
SVIVKSVERNALNMYEARRYLLGLESSGVSVPTSTSSITSSNSSSPPSAPAHPPPLSCPVGLDILASAGLGLTSL